MQKQAIDWRGGLFFAGMVSALASCSSTNAPVTCASSALCVAAVGDAGAGAASGPATLAAFTPPADPGAAGVLFAASGEVLAFTGYGFPPATADDAAF
ncbi:MAG: hypothetical protein JWM82_3494, partial [Myxococcales bacterium]|nr:hypothetical protein [Myxococcales bacterium]